jgi:hypothetical protein
VSNTLTETPEAVSFARGANRQSITRSFGRVGSRFFKRPARSFGVVSIIPDHNRHHVRLDHIALMSLARSAGSETSLKKLRTKE